MGPELKEFVKLWKDNELNQVFLHIVVRAMTETRVQRRERIDAQQLHLNEKRKTVMPASTLKQSSELAGGEMLMRWKGQMDCILGRITAVCLKTNRYEKRYIQSSSMSLTGKICTIF